MSVYGKVSFFPFHTVELPNLGFSAADIEKPYRNDIIRCKLCSYKRNIPYVYIILKFSLFRWFNVTVCYIKHSLIRKFTFGKSKCFFTVVLCTIACYNCHPVGIFCLSSEAVCNLFCCLCRPFTVTAVLFRNLRKLCRIKSFTISYRYNFNNFFSGFESNIKAQELVRNAVYAAKCIIINRFGLTRIAYSVNSGNFVTYKVVVFYFTVTHICISGYSALAFV